MSQISYEFWWLDSPDNSPAPLNDDENGNDIENGINGMSSSSKSMGGTGLSSRSSRSQKKELKMSSIVPDPAGAGSQSASMKAINDNDNDDSPVTPDSSTKDAGSSVSPSPL